MCKSEILDRRISTFTRNFNKTLKIDFMVTHTKCSDIHHDQCRDKY